MRRTPSESGTGAADLRGARLFVLRGSSWGERVAEQITLRGGEARVIPLLDITFAEPSTLREALTGWGNGEYDWLLLTSVNTVHAIERAGLTLPHGEPASQTSPPRRIAAVGPATAEAAAQQGLTVSLIPPADFSTEGMIDALHSAAGPHPARFLFPVSNLTDDRMQRALESRGHTVLRVTAYETSERPAPSDFAAQLGEHAPTVVLVTSGSAAHALHRALPELPAGLHIAAIGRASARALAEHGLVADVVALEQTIPGLLDAVADYLHQRDE